MSEMVACDICGKTSNKSYLNSHKRLAHGRTVTPAFFARNEAEALEVIAALYSQLSGTGKEQIRDHVLGTKMSARLITK